MHSFQEAEKHLTGMEKWCGLCVMPWYKRKKIKVRNVKSYLATFYRFFSECYAIELETAGC